MAAIALLDVAMEIDRLQETLIENSRHAAERFIRFAKDVEDGVHCDAPNGWSSVQELPRDMASLKAKREEFYRLARVTLGKDRARALAASTRGE